MKRALTLTIAAGLAALLVATLVYVRLAPSDPAIWHVDPNNAADPRASTFARIVPGGVTGADPGSLAARVKDAMLAMPRTRLLAGTVADTHMTFVTRSRLMGYPDYTSIRILQDPAGATIAALARSRFGQYDFGVNAARLNALKQALTRN
ncbi:MAG: DUF1499 domain-containing protein [Gemmobacter sp.]|nr:DUF1499 domain-containing protein [Gemmobacter sp.]